MLTVVTGPPGSGKTTYVKQHRGSDDICIDFDLIAEALGSSVSHGHEKRIVAVTVRAWVAALSEAIHLSRLGARIWVVDTKPNQYRERKYRAAGATFINLPEDAPWPEAGHQSQSSA
jgi:predicted kinase